MDFSAFLQQIMGQLQPYLQNYQSSNFQGGMPWGGKGSFIDGLMQHQPPGMGGYQPPTQPPGPPPPLSTPLPPTGQAPQMPPMSTGNGQFSISPWGQQHTPPRMPMQPITGSQPMPQPKPMEPPKAPRPSRGGSYGNYATPSPITSPTSSI